MKERMPNGAQSNEKPAIRSDAESDEGPRFNPYRHDVRLNPYPEYHRFREIDPVNWGEAPGLGLEGCWYLFRYDDVQTLLRDQRLGREWRHVTPPEQQAPSPEPGSFRGMAMNWMLFRDPPTHTRLRSLVTKAFTPRAVEALRPRIEAAAGELLDRAMSNGRQIDLIADYAFPLPVAVIALILGLPTEDRNQFRDWSMTLAAAVDLEHAFDSDILARADRATQELGDYLRGIVADRRLHPRDDLISALLAAEEDGTRLTEDELIATAVLLFVAGHETTVNLIGNGTLALLRQPDEFQRLRQEPGLFAGAVEELLRYDSPVQITFRVAYEDIEVGGNTIRNGEGVAFVLGAANRDPERYPDPDHLKIGRPVGRTAAFGMGIHFCLGAPLARLESQIAFRTLLDRCPSLRLETDAPNWLPGIAFRGLQSLPVSY